MTENRDQVRISKPPSPKAIEQLSPRRSRRPVEREGFVSLPDDDRFLIDPPPSSEHVAPIPPPDPSLESETSGGSPVDHVDQSQPGFQVVSESFPSAKLGTGSIRVPPESAVEEVERNVELASEEQLRPSTEGVSPTSEMDDISTPEIDQAPQPELEEGRIVMPPPPRPSFRPTTQAVRSETRVKTKWSVQTYPGTFRLWNGRGSPGPRSMGELQQTHEFGNVESVQFILQGRDMSFDDVVEKNDEEAFQDMKVRFKDRIRHHQRTIAENRGPVIYDILMVPIRHTDPETQFNREETFPLV